MMTIKQFASLCKCSTQTLRYYDKIDLLKPVKVDPWSGYRYYEDTQAIDFVKIKNLQAAYFSIEEIKILLTKSDQQVYDAFSLKITEQEYKLERIKQIQQSYLTEKNNMEKIIQNVIQTLTGFLSQQVNNYDGLQEFGLKPEDGDKIIAHVRSYMESELLKSIPNPKEITLMVNDEIYRGPEKVAEVVSALDVVLLPDSIVIGDENLSEKDKNVNIAEYDTLWEIHGWNHVYEFIDRIPKLENDGEYGFLFLLNEEKYTEDISFAMFMLGAMILRKGEAKVSMGCVVEKSTDEQNHFTLMVKKE